MAKIVPLSEMESSRLGFTHVINLKVANGDLTTNATTSLIALPAGYIVSKVTLDIKVGWTAGTLSVGDTASGTRWFTTQSLTTALGITTATTTNFVVTAASQFLTVTSASITTAATSELNILLHLADTTLPRSTFA